MHTIPQRKIKARFALFIRLFLLFVATLFLCSIVYLAAHLYAAKIISPLSMLAGQINKNASVDDVKSLCESEHLHCDQIIVLPDGNIHFVTDSQTEVFLSTQKDLKKQLASLQAVISQLTIKGKQLKRVDFRFANVVVAF